MAAATRPPDPADLFDALVDAWAGALGLDHCAVQTLASRLADALRAEPFGAAACRAVGVELVTAVGAPEDALHETLQVVRRHGPAPFGLDRPVGPDGTDGAARFAAGLDALIAGYAQELARRARRDVAQELWASREQFRTMFTEAAVGIGVARMDGTVLDVNPAMLRMFGLTRRLTGPPRVTDFVHPGDSDAFIVRYHELVRGDRDTMRMEIRFVRPDHSVLWADLTASLVRDECGTPQRMIAVVEDGTERRRLRSRLADQTYRDQLTRLPNRSLTEQRLRAMFAAGSPVARVGLAVLDVDRFTAINDSLGHEVGDRLLLAVSSRLRMAGQDNLVTRTGADEFAILVTDPSGVPELLELVDVVLDSFAAPFPVGEHELTITASVGLVESAVEQTSPAELFRAAASALSWAKEDGGGRQVLFDAERDAVETIRFGLMSAMPAAVQREEFRLLYQPLIRLSDTALVGVEALVRWLHPTLGELPPARFIDLAERSGAIVPLGRWVLTRACSRALRWREEFGERAPYVSVNLAPRQLAEPDLVDGVAAVLRETGLPPDQLQLEITEQAVADDRSGALPALRDLGVRLALDDFGTGYANIAQLRRLPVHALKIDGSLIRPLREPGDGEPADMAILDATIIMAHACDLVVTAEWVETAGQADRLASLGCDLAQGHYFGGAVPARDIEARLRLS